MTPLNPELVDLLGDLVAEVRESFEADQYTIPEALAQHGSFRKTKGPESVLTRSIVGDAFRRIANRLGLNPRHGQGGAVELYEQVANGFAVIRLRRAEWVGEELRVAANSSSTLRGFSDEALMPEYHFVFGWLLEENKPLDFFVAEITGLEEGNPGHYLFGWTHHFAMPTPPPASGFQPPIDDGLGNWDRETGDRDLGQQA